MSALAASLRQFDQFKSQHPGYVLFFRIGDFYECFHDDAKLLAKVVGVHLTSRTIATGQVIPMAGVPFHAVEQYLRRMIAAGHKCAICEPVKDDAPTVNNMDAHAQEREGIPEADRPHDLDPLR